jgi:hypothetical protein
MQRVTLTKQLFGKLLQLKHNQVTDLYLVNKNKNNVLVSVTSLRRSGGCKYLPRIKGPELARKIVDIYKSGLTPAGFVISQERSSEHREATEFTSTYELAGQLPVDTVVLFPNQFTLELEVYIKRVSGLAKASFTVEEPND